MYKKTGRSLLSTISIFLLLVIITASKAQQTNAIDNNYSPEYTTTSDGSIYFPLFAGQPKIDLTIQNLEITQAVQRSNNSIPLVQDRQTIVRVFAKTSGTQPVGNVTVLLTASRNGSNLGSVAAGPMSASPTPTRGDYDSTFNIVMPTGWLSGNVSLNAIVDSNDLIEELDEDNNTMSTSIVFNPVPPLDVKLVPINYTHTPTGANFPWYPADTDEISEYVMKIFPLSSINISYRTPINFSGDLSVTDEWNRLLLNIVSIKNADGSPGSQLYYGLLPTANGNGETYPRAWGGWGAGWTRVSIGIVEGGGSLAAHEFGHNFGRMHSPCGNPANIDPNYPYPNGSIGEYGLDVFLERVWTPGPPDNARDLMSYCSPRWVSDYTYLALYNDQRINGLHSPLNGAEGFLVRVELDNEDNAVFLPTYEFFNMVSSSPEEGEYIIELLDNEGEIITQHPVNAFETGEISSDIRYINTFIPSPSKLVVGLQLRKNNEIIAVHTLESIQQTPSTIEITEFPGQLRVSWSESTYPALVRYIYDDLSWVTVGVDIVGGEINLDPNGLPDGNGIFEVVFGR